MSDDSNPGSVDELAYWRDQATGLSLIIERLDTEVARLTTALAHATARAERAERDNIGLREANESLGNFDLPAIQHASTDMLLDELERREAPYRATRTEADLVRQVAELRAILAAGGAEGERDE